MSSRAYDALLYLLENHGTTLSKSQIMQAVWGSSVVEENNLNQAVFSLRRIFGDSKNDSRFIMTVPGRGYCFIAPVNVCDHNVSMQPHNETSGHEWQESQPVAAGMRGAYPLLFYSFLLLFFLANWYVTKVATPRTMEAIDGLATSGEARMQVIGRLRNSVAVLPFTIVNSSGGEDIFSVGLHDELISQLSKIGSINVISRNSIRSMVDQGYSLEAIGRLLKVESFLSGSVIKADSTTRIIMEMHDASSGITLWSDHYDVDQQDLLEMFSVQSEIAINAAQALMAKVKWYERESLAVIPTRSADAYRYQLYARLARYEQDFRGEWEFSRQAILADPDYYEANASFSSANTVLVSNPLPGMTRLQHQHLALSSAEKLIALNPGNSRGYALKAIAQGTAGDWQGVLEQVYSLRDMNAPLSSMNEIALLMLSLGDFDRAIEIYQANLMIEPLNLYARGFLMLALELAGRREEARREYANGEGFSATWWGDTVNIFLSLGRNESLQDVDQLRRVSDDLKVLLHDVHDDDLLRQGVHKYQEMKNDTPSGAILYAALASHLGEHELAVEYLRSALTDNWSNLFWSWLPVFDETRKLQAFRELLRDSGIVSHWKRHGWPVVCQSDNGDEFRCDWTAAMVETGSLEYLPGAL